MRFKFFLAKKSNQEMWMKLENTEEISLRGELCNSVSEYDVYRHVLNDNGCYYQREGMGLLEYQAMPSLHAWCSSWWMAVYIYCITAAGNSFSSQLSSSWQGNQYGTEKAGGTARPSRTKSHLPGHSPSASQAGRHVGPALNSFRPHWLLQLHMELITGSG